MLTFFDLLGIFDVYDIDQNGSIAHNEMLQIVQSVYKMAGEMVQLPKDEKTPEAVWSVSMAGMRTDGKDFGWQSCVISEWRISSRIWIKIRTTA